MATISKTNALRMLDAAGVAYSFHTLDITEAHSGVDVANLLNIECERVFKTLVTQGKTGNHYVFVIPVAEELDLKKAAKVAGEKSIAMIKSKDLLPLTGYVHGGCSPIGMKKVFPSYIDETAILFDCILFSGGRIGLQLEIALEEASKVLDYSLADIVV